MTLLVLDLPVPQVTRATNADVLNALGDLRPNFASFVLSFSLVGLNWMNHRMFRAVARSDQRLMQLNLLQLLVVCFVPFTAALLSRYGDLATAVTVYASNLCLMGIVAIVIRLHLSRGGLWTRTLALRSYGRSCWAPRQVLESSRSPYRSDSGVPP